MSQSDPISVSLEKIEKPEYSSFHTGVYRQPYFSGSWHYHPEIELLSISEGYGKRLVGDHVDQFKPDDLVLLGGLLPHAWIPDESFLKKESEKFCESIYVQFNKEIFGSFFVSIPELKGVRKILNYSERGLKITGKHKNKINLLLRQIPDLQPFNRLLHLLEILNLISLSDYEILVSENYLKNSFYFKSNRMLKIHEYLMENYKKEIQIGTCAEIANMTVSSFCRFFKNETNTTFSNYLNTIRIDISKKLLSNTNYAIKEIGFECGYNSTPYFNKQFKKIVGSTPFQFRKMQSKN